MLLVLCSYSISGQNLLGNKFVDYSNEHSIDEDGNTIAVINKIPNGDQNIEVFDYVNNQWQARPSSSGFVGSQIQLSNDGNTLIVGAPSLSPPEIVTVFHWDGSNWNQRGNAFTSNTANTTFGTRVYVNDDGTRIFFKGVQDVYFNYQWNGTTWVLLNTFNNLGFRDISINSAGTRIAYTENNSTSSSIANYSIKILELNTNDTWSQIGNDINNPLQLFSSSIIVNLEFNSSGDRLAIASATSFDFNTNAGAFVVYEYFNDQWTQVGDIITGENENDFLGLDIAINSTGNKVFAGIPSSDAFGQSSGQCKLFELDLIQNNWNEILDINGELAGSQAGTVVDMNGSGDIVSIGADGILPQVRVFGVSNLSINENSLLKLKLYPNPSYGEIFLDVNQKSKFEIYDVNGRVAIRNQSLKQGRNNIKFNGLDSGLYFIKIYNENGQKVEKIQLSK